MADLDEKLGRLVAIAEGTRDDVRQIREHITRQDREIEDIRVKGAETRTWLKVLASVLGIGLLGGGSAAAAFSKIFQ